MRRTFWTLAFCAALPALLAGCGSSSSAFNPTPSIGCVSGTNPQCGLFPAQITAGSDTFTLFISGNGFISQSVALWNGAPRPTTYDPTTNQLQVIVFAADVAQPGNVNVAIENPEPSGPPAVSADATFGVAAQTNFEPQIASVCAQAGSSGSCSPSVPAGSAAFTLSIAAASGSQFDSSDYVTWNGSLLLPQGSQITASQIQVDIPATLVSACGFASVSVSTATVGVASPSSNFNAQGSCTPSVTGLSPSSTGVGKVPASGITIMGANFTKSSVAIFNGSPRLTTYASSTRITAQVQPSDVATAGAVVVSVVNPSGGISPSVPSPQSGPANIFSVN